ncbi:hypothetical protein ILP97_05970 [Amycolatopsis sp. H6(2020)]|nr:hypothetical protein [Amycolatopsis sp. H6(2020)]
MPYADRAEFREQVAAFMSVTALTVSERQARLGRLVGYWPGWRRSAAGCRPTTCSVRSSWLRRTTIGSPGRNWFS